jgi:hypothetical protein
VSVSVVKLTREYAFAGFISSPNPLPLGSRGVHEPASRLGPYEITDPLGAGGMRESYLAQDTQVEPHCYVELAGGEVG